MAVVSDLQLGSELDGIDLLREVQRRHPGCRRVLVTGAEIDDHIARAVGSGIIHEVIGKPWAGGAVVAAVQACAAVAVVT